MLGRGRRWMRRQWLVVHDPLSGMILVGMLNAGPVE